MRIPKAPPRTIQRTVERPAADAVPGQGPGKAQPSDAGKKAGAATDPGSIKPAKAALVGFGQTEDATADVNPITSPDAKIDRGEETGRELANVPAGFMKNALLPSEMGAEKTDAPRDSSPFAAQDAAFDSAGGDMERGLDAQRALNGRTVETETVEDPSSVGGTDHAADTDPSDPTSRDGANVQASTREGLGIAIGGAKASADSGSSLQQDFDSQQWDTRMQGLPSRNNKS